MDVLNSSEKEDNTFSSSSLSKEADEELMSGRTEQEYLAIIARLERQNIEQQDEIKALRKKNVSLQEQLSQKPLRGLTVSTSSASLGMSQRWADSPTNSERSLTFSTTSETKSRLSTTAVPNKAGDLDYCLTIEQADSDDQDSHSYSHSHSYSYNSSPSVSYNSRVTPEVSARKKEDLLRKLRKKRSKACKSVDCTERRTKGSKYCLGHSNAHLHANPNMRRMQSLGK